ncbi:transcription factor IIA, alpha/beta subunit [Tricharina praecox]|uniref:transcription factor IIA, alpha/beta subunit n=1 Tax=Tricharina praecox TaxID=43433 RepID=UPI0022209733|nr:transcription factor IIA, alpha/beta subunit [Tricharina praecox]KAI5844112.1 transcription factor IIA, alpha/beta subunit [Tricharina praecox]
MSNQLVGTVYQSIIDEVINSSRLDFEEAGINVSTLEDLKQVWQGKLSGLKIAHFPWDPPAPEAPSNNATAAQARAAQQQQQQQQQQQAQQQQMHQQQMHHQQQQQQQQQQQSQQPYIKSEPGMSQQYPQVQNGVKIKSEPGMEPQGVMYGVPQANLTGNPTHDPHLAAMRAQHNIAQKFGPQLQARPASGLVLPGMNPGPPPQHRPANGQQQHNGIPQHDGGDDEEIPIEGFGSLTREEADKVLLTRIGKAERQRAEASEKLAQALQNLKVSSAKSKAKGKGKARRARKLDAYEEALNHNSSYPYPSETPMLVLSSNASSGPRVPQLDGDSEDEIDEDAINSDLDDPEEDEIDNEDDDEVPQIMLCMYDKVQRTKNKWKCVLKDGVLTINGQEYVFHKANGEYEW